MDKFDFTLCPLLEKKIEDAVCFESVCETKLVEWYHKHKPSINIARHNVVIVWSSKVLQNYKCLVATTVLDDGVYAEYTYSGDKEELYEDVYEKVTNTCYKEE